MTYPGMLPPGQTFASQQEQQYMSQDGYQHHPQQPQLHHQQQIQHAQQLSQPHHQPHLAQHHQQAQQPHPGNPQVYAVQHQHPHGQYLQHQHQQLQHQQLQHQQHQQSMQAQPHPYGAGLNVYQGFDAGTSLHGAQQTLSPSVSYMPPPAAWQQPIQQLHSPQSPHQYFHPPQQQQQQQHQHQQDIYGRAFPSPQQQQQLQLHQQQKQPSRPQSFQQLQHALSPKSRSQPAPAAFPPPEHQQHDFQQQHHVQASPQPQPPTFPELSQPRPQFVNLQDIQQQTHLPLHTTMGNALGRSSVKHEAEPEHVKPMEDCIIAAPPPPEAMAARPLEDSITVKTQPARVPEVKPNLPRVKTSPRSSVSMSPAPASRSPSISKKSPAVSHKTRPVDTLPMMMAVAEECLDKARSSVHDVAMSMHPDLVDEYQRLVATSLACLEASLQSGRLAPREEARVRLRYAAVLQEETDNLMEAETALSKGITLCDKHRLFDLKYCMQYLLLKVLFQRNHKAALTAIDRHINDCETFKHVQWYYAFRLLKATFYIEMGHASEASAFDNIRAIQNVAKTRGDNAVGVFASLLEGLTLLKTPKEGNSEKVQACVAHAAKYQLDSTVNNIPQINILTPLIEVASTLNSQHPDITSQSLRLLQKRLDECEEWHNVKPDFLLPIKKQPSAARTVSNDTASIIRAGADNESDFLVMSFMTKMELRSLVFIFSGLVSLHKPSTQGRRSTELWREGLKILDAWDSSTAGIRYGPCISLNAAIRQRDWRVEAQAFLNVLLGLLAASHCQWDNVKQLMAKVEASAAVSKQSALVLLSIYLNGVYHQGTGDLQTALGIFNDARFNIPHGSGAKAGQSEIALLANMNRLWIMQHPSCQDDQTTVDLLEQLQPLCANHPNIELRIAWHNVVAALVTEPPMQMNEKKQHMHAAIGGTKITNNFLGAAVTLCIMRSRFFENVIGEQAIKSALAAAKQAQKSGNLLWQSVADGMLAHSYEVQGQRYESSQEWEKATREARDAFSGSS